LLDQGLKPGVLCAHRHLEDMRWEGPDLALLESRYLLCKLCHQLCLIRRR
jgi:hypothetical protein